MKVSKSFIENLVLEELRDVLLETAQDDIDRAEKSFEDLLSKANLQFYFKNGKFYITLPFVDPKKTRERPRKPTTEYNCSGRSWFWDK